MSWFIFALLCVFFVSFANIIRKVLMKDDKSDPFSYAVIFHFLIGVINLIFALIVGFRFPEFNLNLIFLFLSAALWGGCSIFIFKALQLLESSEVTILSSLRVLITIIASIIFLQESFNFQKIIGTILILISVVLVSNLKKGFKFNKGVTYTFWMVLFSGLAITVDAFNIKHYDPISYNAIQNFLISLMILIIYPKTIFQWKSFIKPSFIKAMLPLAMFSAIQGIFYYYALAKGGNASQVGPITQAQVVLTVLLAVIFLKEKDYLLQKITASVLVTIGVLLLK